MLNMSPTFTIQQFHRRFPTNEACLEDLFQRLHRDATCAACGQKDKYYLQKGTAHYVCSCGGSQISPKNGTIFHKSETDLVKWYYAIFLMSQSRNGVAALELQRHIGVKHYQTALRMTRMIRSMMDENADILFGKDADAEMVCEYCGKQFYRDVRPSRLKRPSRFCSADCQRKAPKNYASGERQGSWNGGNSSYRQRLAKVRPIECEDCGYKKFPRLIHVHHKDMKPRHEKRSNEIENLQFLCIRCHLERHLINGKMPGDYKLTIKKFDALIASSTKNGTNS